MNLGTSKWINIVKNFDISIKVYLNSSEKWVFSTKEWKEFLLETPILNFEIDKNFYVKSKKIKLLSKSC